MPDNAAPILILTRPAAASARFRARLGRALDGIEVIESPVIEIVPLSPPLPAREWRGLILTSEQGAAAAARLDVPRLAVWAVGERTAEVAASLGYPVAGVEPDAAALVPRMIADRPPAPLLHIRGTHARGAIAERLTDAGLPADEIIGYDQRECPLSPDAIRALAGPRPVVLPVFSPRTAEILAAQGTPAAPLHVVAISAAAARPFADIADVSVARSPDAEAMAETTAAAIARARE